MRSRDRRQLIQLQADHAFNFVDNVIEAAEQNLEKPPSETYFLPTPPPVEDVESSALSSSEDAVDDASIRTADLTPAHLSESELRALRRRMKKSHSWIPTTTCIKKELQAQDRWPLKSVHEVAREKRRSAKLENKRQKKLQMIRQERAASARSAVASRIRDKRRNQKENRLKVEKNGGLPATANEPTYCYCEDVSYGEMIACENEVRNIHTITP